MDDPNLLKWEIFKLRVRDDLTYPEIGKIFGKSPARTRELFWQMGYDFYHGQRRMEFRGFRIVTDDRPMTKVVHCKRESYQVYIGRPSKWGNPFQIGKDGTREEVIEKYKAWILDQPDLLKAIIPELKGKTLGCWCHPRACHGDILAMLADTMDRKIELRIPTTGREDNV
jgi:hypothetical protein